MKHLWGYTNKKEDSGQCLTLVEDDTIVVVSVTDQRSGKTIIVLYKMTYGQNQTTWCYALLFPTITIEQWKQFIPFLSYISFNWSSTLSNSKHDLFSFQ